MAERLKNTLDYVKSGLGDLMSNSTEQEHQTDQNQTGYDPLEERDQVYELLGDLGQAMSSEEVQQAIQDGDIDYDHAVEMVDDLEQYVEEITHYQRVVEELEEKEWEQYGQDMCEIRSRLEDRLEDIQQYQSDQEQEEQDDSERQAQQFVDDLQGVRDTLRDAQPSDQKVREKEQRLDRINSILEED